MSVQQGLILLVLLVEGNVGNKFLKKAKAWVHKKLNSGVPVEELYRCVDISKKLTETLKKYKAWQKEKVFSWRKALLF